MEKSSAVLSQLSSALGRRDEVPNQELAGNIVKSEDREAIEVLVTHLHDKKLQNDCIKVLYEVGEKNPKLIADHLDQFIDLLGHKNNRMQWGAMAALNHISTVQPEKVYKHLSIIVQAADQGSVITRDHAVNILLKLITHRPYAEAAFSLLLEQLLKCPPNQLPMYAERALPVIDDLQKAPLTKRLQDRLPDIEKESKKKRVVKVINKLMK